MKPVTTLMSLPLEIHTEILRHVLKAKHIRLLHESTHIAVREPKHSAILLTCKYFHKNFSTLLSQGSCAMLGFSFMFDEELEEADVEYDPESNRGLSIPCSLVDFNTHNEVQTFLTGKNGKRLLGLGELELRSIESEDVYDILSSLDGKIGVKKLTWTSGETETLSQEAATSQSTSIPKDLILDPQNAHLHVPSQEDEGIQHNARMWSFLHNICNADVNVRIEFGLSHWVTCQTKPEIRHKLHGRFSVDTNDSAIKPDGKETITEDGNTAQCMCKQGYRIPRRARQVVRMYVPGHHPRFIAKDPHSVSHFKHSYKVSTKAIS